MKIGIKYCGHCRPFLDMTQLVPLLRTERPDLDFVPASSVLPGDGDCGAMLRLNACPTACASVPDFAGHHICVDCEAEDQFDPDPGRLLRRILAELPPKIVDPSATDHNE